MDRRCDGRSAVLAAGASCLDTSAAPLINHDYSTKFWVMLALERVHGSCIERRAVHLIRCRSNTSSRAPLGACAVISGRTIALVACRWMSLRRGGGGWEIDSAGALWLDPVSRV